MTSNSIVFAINNDYAPYLYICLKSLLAQTQTQNKYQIYVLETELFQKHKEYIKSLQTENLKIEFIDIKKFLNEDIKKTFQVTAHFTPETYYRFFLPKIFPDLDKVLYLDADTLIIKDIAPLFSIDIKNNYLGVTHDCEILRMVNIAGNKYSDYFTKTLGINVNSYFQAGVMLVNLAQMRQDNITEKLLSALKKIKTPKFVDQDILNMVCQDKILFIKQNWNYTWHLPLADTQYLEHLPDFIKKSYEDARQDPYIVHFTGNKMKPIDYPETQYADIFWRYAQQTVYYTQLTKEKENSLTQKQIKINSIKKKIKKYKILNMLTLGVLQKIYLNKIYKKKMN